MRGSRLRWMDGWMDGWGLACDFSRFGVCLRVREDCREYQLRGLLSFQLWWLRSRRVKDLPVTFYLGDAVCAAPRHPTLLGARTQHGYTDS